MWCWLVKVGEADLLWKQKLCSSFRRHVHWPLEVCCQGDGYQAQVLLRRPLANPRKPVWYPGLMSWMKGFQIFNFSCVSWKEGIVLEWLLFKGKIRRGRKEESGDGRTGPESHAANGTCGEAVDTDRSPQTRPSDSRTESRLGSKASPWGQRSQHDVISTNYSLLTADRVPATLLAPYTPRPINSHTRPARGLIITI